MKDRTKRQHYVPRFYLKGFTSDGSSIHVYDKQKGTGYKSNIIDVGQERYFYEMPELEREHLEALKRENLDEKTMMESVLAMYDSACANYVENVLRNINVSRLLSVKGEYQLSLSQDQKFGLSLFAAISDLRTKETREKIAQMNHLTTEWAVEFIAAEKFPNIDMTQFKIQTREDLGSVFQAQLLLNQERLEGIARVSTFGRIWVLAVNETSTPFLISDHPIIRRSHDPHPFYGGGGWASPYLEVGIPLSPKLMMALFCPLIFRDHHKNGTEWQLNNTVMQMTDEDVMYYNSLQCQNSYRFLYSSDGNWSMAEKYLAEFPANKNPVRQKVSVDGFGKKWKLHDDWRMPKSKKGE